MSVALRHYPSHHPLPSPPPACSVHHSSPCVLNVSVSPVCLPPLVTHYSPHSPTCPPTIPLYLTSRGVGGATLCHRCLCDTYSSHLSGLALLNQNTRPLEPTAPLLHPTLTVRVFIFSALTLSRKLTSCLVDEVFFHLPEDVFFFFCGIP